MVFYMLNKIADCAENVVRNFSHREHFPEAMLRICQGYLTRVELAGRLLYGNPR